MSTTKQHEERRPLGRKSGLTTTALGLGSASLGDMYERISDEQALGAVRAAAEGGVTYFDTAPWYGIGLAEARFGLGLRHHPRTSYQLSTKVGRTLIPIEEDHRNVVVAERSGWQGTQAFDVVFDFSYDAVIRQHQDSLQRLGLGRVDCLVIHDMEQSAGGGAGGMSLDLPPGMEAADVKSVAANTETLFSEKGGFNALEALRAAGKIKAFGAGVNCPADVMATDVASNVEEASAWAKGYCQRLADANIERPIDFFLLAGNYTLLDLTAYESGIMDLCAERGIGVVLGAPFCSGILATGAVPGAKYVYEDAPPEIMERVKRMEAICESFGVPLAAVALQFPLGHPAVTCVIPGGKSAFEVERNIQTMNIPIPKELWQKFIEDGLLPSGIPTP